MHGTPVGSNEVPEELWEILPTDCTLRHDADFLYLYRVNTLIIVLNKRADGAAMARLLEMVQAGRLGAHEPS